MASYQVLFNGETLDSARVDVVRENLARELGLDERKARQLFSGRTVVIRSQLEQHEAQAWQERFAELGAICRIKNLGTQERPLGIRDGVQQGPQQDRTLRDITAAHCECPRCGHMQLDASHCARCGVDLEAAFRQKRKEDLIIEKKLRELRQQRAQEAQEVRVERTPHPSEEKTKRGVLHWLRRG